MLGRHRLTEWVTTVNQLRATLWRNSEI